MPTWSSRAALVTALAAVVLAPSSVDGAGTGGEPLTIGVVPQRTYDDRDTDAMRDAGITSMRVWFPWAQIERRQGDRNWEPLDRAVATNAEAGITTLPFLFGTPEWAARADGEFCSGTACMPFAPRTEESRRAFAEFAAAAVRRYGPDGTFWDQHRALDPLPIDVWQVWNEPNLVSFHAPAVDPLAYAAMVMPVAEAIHEVDPKAQVLLAGLTGTESNDRRMSTGAFLTALYSVPDVATTFDGIAVHPYNRKARGTLQQVKAARRIADAHGDDAGIWVTELGWASGGKRRWGLVKSPEGQARLLTKVIGRLADHADDWGVHAVYWYSWRDTDRGEAVCGWCPWSGLLDRLGHEKPAYDALRELTD
jgi:polysaccharide biosynthesis protein PslG